MANRSRRPRRIAVKGPRTASNGLQGYMGTRPKSTPLGARYEAQRTRYVDGQRLGWISASGAGRGTPEPGVPAISTGDGITSGGSGAAGCAMGNQSWPSADMPRRIAAPRMKQTAASRASAGSYHPHRRGGGDAGAAFSTSARRGGGGGIGAGVGRLIRSRLFMGWSGLCSTRIAAISRQKVTFCAYFMSKKGVGREMG